MMSTTARFFSRGGFSSSQWNRKKRVDYTDVMDPFMRSNQFYMILICFLVKTNQKNILEEHCVERHHECNCCIKCTCTS